MENNYTRETIYKINDLATQFYQEQLKKSKEAQEPPELILRHF